MLGCRWLFAGGYQSWFSVNRVVIEGRLRISARDITISMVIGDQFALRIDQVALLLGVPVNVAYKWVNRMRTQRWVEGQQIHGRLWVWLTGRGLRQLDLPYRPLRPSPMQLDHLYEINQVRIWYARLHPELEWVSERFIRRAAAPGNQAQHIPDGVLIDYHNERCTAIEVEINPKTVEQTYDIINRLLSEYTTVHYVCSERATRVVQRAYELLIRQNPELQGRLRLTMLSVVASALAPGK